MYVRMYRQLYDQEWGLDFVQEATERTLSGTKMDFSLGVLILNTHREVVSPVGSSFKISKVCPQNISFLLKITNLKITKRSNLN